MPRTPMTMAEKILARAAGKDCVRSGDFVTATVDRIMINDLAAMLPDQFEEIGLKSIPDPERVVVVIDHYFPAPNSEIANLVNKGVERFLTYGATNYLGPAGVSHQVLCERGFIEPGALVLGSDSHSSMYGAFGAAGAGVGATEMLYVLVMGELWFQVPPSIRFTLTGRLPDGVYAKDLVLSLIGAHGGDYGLYKSLEYDGPGAASLSMSERMTISNMGVEFGAKFAMFEADETTLSFLRKAGAKGKTFSADAGAAYEAVHNIDLTALSPQIACPDAPDNVAPIGDVAGAAIDQAYLGSCTNARLDDIAIAAEILKGKTVNPGTRLFIAPASRQVTLEATRAGYMEILMEAGAHLLSAGCGACAGLHSGILGAGEVCLSSTNRNFKGRMGSAEASIYLGSPASVAASAITGVITDPREFI